MALVKVNKIGELNDYYIVVITTAISCIKNEDVGDVISVDKYMPQIAERFGYDSTQFTNDVQKFVDEIKARRETFTRNYDAIGAIKP